MAPADRTFPRFSSAFCADPQARFVALLIAAWMLFVAAVYLPDVGRGFVKDDFGWVVLHGVQPRGYGLTNLALYLACALALWTLCRALRLSPPAAAVAVLAWAANPHGINMALVWISGRTSLCLTLLALLAAIAITRRPYVWVGLFLACALGSKEEALALPMILFAWHRLANEGHASRGFDWRLLAALTLPAAIYCAIRLQTGALTPASAPPYYQFTFAPAIVLRNAIEYADRAATASAIVVAIAALIFAGRVARTARRHRVLAACAIWFAGGFILTVFLPVRSSLYAVFPSVGAAIACAVLVERFSTSAAVDNAVRLHMGPAVEVWIDPPPGDWQLAGLRPPAPDRTLFSFAVDHGRIWRVAP